MRAIWPFVRWGALVGLVWSLPTMVTAQSAFSPSGGEYYPSGRLPGDQVHGQLALTARGGWVVWQDNATDNDGLGISAQRLNENLAAVLSTFRVNEKAEGDQENPQVALFKNGGAVFVWQGGVPGFQKIYARFLKADYTFATGDVLVNSFQQNQQINPGVAVLADGTVIVVWASYGQDGSMFGVFARRLSASGAKLGDEFQVNQTTSLNQRTPAVTALSNGGFLIGWVCEKYGGVDASGLERYEVNTVGRQFSAQGAPAGDEFQLNTQSLVCANPALVALETGGFIAAWSQKEINPASRGWEIVARSFDSSGQPLSAGVRINSYVSGDQFAPRLAALGEAVLITWTSMLQDGSWEGIFGQFCDGQLQKQGDEFQINTTSLSKQIQPAVASDGQSRFLVLWSSFTPDDAGFDLASQRYASAQVLAQPAPPFVSALSQSRLSVTWPALSGFEVDHYELLLDGNSTPLTTVNNFLVADKLAQGSTHTFRLLYQLKDGRRSPLSEIVTGSAWGEDANWDGLPDDWQAKYWGGDSMVWPGGGVDSDLDGATNLQEFLAGTNPRDPNSVLRTSLSTSALGWRLNWNSEPGFVYQVQCSTNLAVWNNIGAPRFAAGTTDSLPVDPAQGEAFYRVIRVR